MRNWQDKGGERVKKKSFRKTAAGLLSASMIVTSGVLPGAEAAAAEESGGGPQKAYRLVYDEPAPQVLSEEEDPYNCAGWREYSIPLGNAYMGLNLFGGVDHDRIQITENTLQDSNSTVGGLNNFSETYLDFDYGYDAVTNYQRELSLDNGITTVEYDYNGTHYTREYFASYPDKVMVIHLESEGDGTLDFTLRPTIPYICDGRDVNEDGQISGSAEESRGKSGKVVAAGDTITLSGEMEYYGLEFEGQYKVITDGQCQAVNDENNENGTIKVTGAGSATIVMGLDTNFDMESKLFTESDPQAKLEGNEPAHDRVNAIMDAVAGKDYSELKETHISDYQSMYGRVDVDLGGSVPEDLMTDDLIANYKNGDYDNSAEGLYLEALAYQYGRYLLICSSREGGLPTNLQGIWNVYQDPSWRAGMWHNINEQMNYWGAFTSNLAETFEPYIDYWKAYVEKAEEYATSNISKYNKDGQMEGTDAYDDGWALGNSTWPYNISGSSSHSGFGTGPFMSILFWDYFDYTQDIEILEDKTYPAISGMSKFLSKVVSEDEEGKLLAQHSYSPEVQVATDSGTQSYGTVGCTFDQSMIYENHLDTMKAAEILTENGISLSEEDQAAVDVFEKQLPLLDPILVGSSGQLKEYREEDYYGEIGTEPTHRHTSQLVGVYPGTMVNSSTPAWQDAAKVSLSRREEDPDKTKGWSKAHRAAIWARLYEGDRAYNDYQKLIKVNLMSNLFNDHGGSTKSSSRVFQADANYGIMAAVGEMLLQSHEGFIAPLAGIPGRWSTGSYEGLSARGNFEVSAQWTGGQADSFTILSGSGGQCKVKYANISSASVEDESGKAVSFTADGDDMIVFNTEKGGTYTITDIPAHATVQDPSNLTLNVNQDKELEVSWDASPDAVSYNIYRAEESASVYAIYAEGVTDTSYTGGFKEGAQATYKVTAVGSDGTESKGIYMTFVPTEKVEAAKGYFLEDGTLQIQVQDPLRTEDTEYILYRAMDNGEYEEIMRTPYTVMQLEGIAGDDVLAMSRVEYTGESKKTEVEYFAQIEENVCLDKPAEATRGTMSSYGLELALDGDTGTRLAFSKGAGQITMTIDLENEWELDTLSVYEFRDKKLTNENQTRAGYTKIEITTDGENWETVHDNVSLKGGATVYFDMQGKAASKIRMTFENQESADAVTIYEIQCSAKKDIYDKLELFNMLAQSDEYEENPVYGIGVDDSLMAAYEEAKAAAVNALENTAEQTREEVDAAKDALQSALAAIVSDAAELTAQLLEEAAEVIQAITPENELYVQENYDNLISAMDTAEAALEDMEDQEALENAAKALNESLRMFKGENPAGTVSLDLSPGFYEGQQAVTVTVDNDSITEICYTLDGTEPSKESAKAAGGTITLPYGVSILKVAGYTDNGTRTKTVTERYMCRPENNLALEQTAAASNDSYKDQYPASNAVDGDTSTRWVTTGTGASLSVTFDSPLRIDSVYVDEFKNSSNTQDNRLYEYKLEYQQEAGGEWIMISSGNLYEEYGRTVAASGSGHSYVGIGFEPVTAAAVRITGPEEEGAAAITIYELEIYGEEAANAANTLNEALREAAEIVNEEYTSDSVAVLETAVTAAEKAAGSGSAEEMKAAAQALRSALDALVKMKAVIISQPGDITVQAGEEAVLSVTAEGYMPAYQWQRLDGSIWRTIGDASEAEYRFTAEDADNGAQFRCIINDIGGNIVTETAAVTVSTEPVVDKSALEMLYDQYKDLEKSGYTQATWQTFTDAQKTAEAVLNNAEASQEEVASAYESLQAAIEGLRVSKNTLEYFLNRAKEHMANGDTANVVESVRQLFAEAVAEGEAVMAKENANKEEVSNATIKLMKAIQALDFKAGDKTDLEMALELAGMISLDKYTESGKEEFLVAKEAADTVLADKDAMQADVDSAWRDLVNAMDGLRLKADKAALEELLDSVAGLDLSQYTEESVQVFKAVLAEAKAVLTDENLSVDEQEEVDAAVKALEDAKNQLVLTAGDPGDDGPKPGGDEADPGDNEQKPNGDAQKPGESGNDSNNGKDEGKKAVKTGDTASAAGVAAAAAMMLAGVLCGAAVIRKRREK